MHVAFVVHMVKGADADTLLSEETKRDTQAVVMSLDDAGKMGFSTSGITAKPGQEVNIIIVARRDAPWVRRQIEAHDHVAGFHEVDVNLA
ncbi:MULTISPECIES: hypothetical protein [Polyangium]|uniref:Uncharacterized protein n=2 Tax=Polyangium TaxID=55 RepID=A0A4U1JKK9_9BACT|nr:MULTISPECIES: hypothetical protein [Polyangium]MDI1431744.1 hypothetical protein [Polyangium sorediatum]TKD13294.1 hypothetical protein E8A74_01725 [Polyangium fumosum]